MILSIIYSSAATPPVRLAGTVSTTTSSYGVLFTKTEMDDAEG